VSLNLLGRGSLVDSFCDLFEEVLVGKSESSFSPSDEIVFTCVFVFKIVGVCKFRPEISGCT
jgi:hypothetical protein